MEGEEKMVLSKILAADALDWAPYPPSACAKPSALTNLSV
jgi:hypothetical protein